MAEESAKLRIPYIAAAQAQKHITHNEAMTLLDTLVQLSVIDKDLTAPPANPIEGDCYIVAGGGGSATGDWIGWDNRVARYLDGAWRSYLPGEGSGAGWLAWVQDEDAMYRFDGNAWALAGIEGPEGPSGWDQWQGAWASGQGYVLHDGAQNDGSSYICIVPHTATAETEPGTGVNWPTVWDLLAAKGQDGAGGSGTGTGSDGADGEDGKTVLSGIIDPASEGVDGDFYINTNTWTIFGPKASDTWPSGVSLVGPAGADGDDGAPGADGQDGVDGATGAPGADGQDGADGNTVLYGTIDPTSEGVDGNFYINTVTWTIFGPKASDSWPSGVSLVGPAGADGQDGADGSGGGSAGPMATARYSDTTGQSVNSTGWTAMSWDTTDHEDTSGFSHDTVTDNSRVTILNDGPHLIAATISVEGTTTNYRYNGDLQVLVNGTDELAPEGSWGYIRGTSGANYAGITLTFIHDFAAGDYIEVRVRRASNTNGNGTRRPGGCHLSIAHLTSGSGGGGSGTDGQDGADGQDGKTVLSGTIDPTSEGVDGDFYINTATWTIFGPKASDAWPTGVALVGPAGADGLDLTTLEDGTVTSLGVNTGADATNRLAVKSDSVLLSHDDVTPGTGDMRVSLNKSETARDAGFTFQTGYGTRALFGLLGDDDFSLKVSPDGGSFSTALTVDKDNGAVDHAEGSKFEATTNYENYIASDTWTKIAFNNTVHNDQGDLDGGNNHFVAPSDGYYLIGAKWRFKANGPVPAQVLTRLYQNGVGLERTTAQSDGDVVSTRTMVQTSTVLKLAAGDEIAVYAYLRTNDGYVDDHSSLFYGARIA